ncbi:MAG: PIG-L family deacetylase [Pseudomonadota bacterium]
MKRNDFKVSLVEYDNLSWNMYVMVFRSVIKKPILRNLGPAFNEVVSEHEKCTRTSAGPVLFLLAHPDDEILVRPLIVRSLKANGAIVVYLTKGNGNDAQIRPLEALKALEDIGVPKQAVFFIGHELDILDGKAISNLQPLFDRLTDQAFLPSIGSLVTHAFEGGHPDHDAAHIIGLKLAHFFSISQVSFAIPFYRRSKSGFPPYIVQYPPPDVPGFQRIHLDFDEAITIVLAIRHHPSQIKTFIGLGPWLIMRAIFDRTLYVQKLSESVAPNRPMDEPLLIEKRYNVLFQNIAKEAHSFLER